MQYRQNSWRLAVVAAVFALAACDSYVQTTSGKEYLSRYEQSQNVNEGSLATNMAADNQAVREIANVEPQLRFPARIGIARIFNGQLSAIPADEAQQWRELADRLGPDYGEFVPISPLVAALAAGSVGSSRAGQNESGSYGTLNRFNQFDSAIIQTVRMIRFGAARQHVDAVLIYEVYADSDVETNVLSVTKLVLIGFFMAPSEEITANGFANAMLVDVRNGYVYGYAQSNTDKAVKSLSTSVGEDTNVRQAESKARSGAVGRLVVDVEDMARELRLQLAERRAKAAEAKVAQ